MTQQMIDVRVNPSDETIRLGPLAVRFLLEAAEVVHAAAGGPPDRARMAEIMIRHGLTPAPPRPKA